MSSADLNVGTVGALEFVHTAADAVVVHRDGRDASSTFPDLPAAGRAPGSSARSGKPAIVTGGASSHPAGLTVRVVEVRAEVQRVGLADARVPRWRCRPECRSLQPPTQTAGCRCSGNQLRRSGNGNASSSARSGSRSHAALVTLDLSKPPQLTARKLIEARGRGECAAQIAAGVANRSRRCSRRRRGRIGRRSEAGTGAGAGGDVTGAELGALPVPTPVGAIGSHHTLGSTLQPVLL